MGAATDLASVVICVFRSMRLPPLRKLRKTLEIASDQSFFLCARPALHLPFDCNRVNNPIKPLGEYKRHRPTLGCVAAESSCVVLGDPPLQARPRRAGVIAAIGATQDVEVGALDHGPASQSSTPFSIVGTALILRDARTQNPASGARLCHARSSG